LQTGDYLGDLTDELEKFGSGFFIAEFYRVAQKLCIYGLLSCHLETHIEM